MSSTTTTVLVVCPPPPLHKRVLHAPQPCLHVYMLIFSPGWRLGSPWIRALLIFTLVLDVLSCLRRRVSPRMCCLMVDGGCHGSWFLQINIYCIVAPVKKAVLLHAATLLAGKAAITILQRLCFYDHYMQSGACFTDHQCGLQTLCKLGDWGCSVFHVIEVQNMEGLVMNCKGN